VKISKEWFSASGAEFRARDGRHGVAHLTCYSAEYCEWGVGPPLVLVPGLAGGYELLGPLARLLAKKYRVISFQLRGENDCFALRRRFTLEDLVQDLAEFLAWHRLEQPALMGVSFGGVLALEFAASYASRIRSLIIHGAGAHFERGLVQQVASMVLSRYPLPNDNPFVNQFFNLLFGRRQKQDSLFQFVTRQCWQTDQSVMAHRLHLVESFNVVDRLDRVQVPALVLAGARDPLVSTRSLAILSQGLPNVRLCRLSGCGHLAFATQPDRVAQEVQDFLGATEKICV